MGLRGVKWLGVVSGEACVTSQAPVPSPSAISDEQVPVKSNGPQPAEKEGATRFPLGGS